MTTAGYRLSQRSKTYHALDSFVYEYLNSGGMKDNLKIEINYMCQAQDNAIPLALSNSIPVIVKSILFGHAHCLMRGARKAVGVPVPRSNCLSSF